MNRLPRPVPKSNNLLMPLPVMAVVLTFLVIIAAAMPARSATRVALLIGNADYALPSMDLGNPVNDVNALEPRLDALNFTTRTVRDTDLGGMNAALDWFEAEAKGAEIALIFYAGHGVQLGGENYLIGADLAGFSQGFMQESSLRLSEIKEVMDRVDAGIGVIILDACRNNPFLATGWADKGLAVTTGGSGLLIAYATDPGNVAYDGLGENSVFTSALLDNIATDGLDIRIMFGRVRQQVVRETGGAQIPWVEESVLGEHYLGDPRQQVAGVIDDEVARWRAIAASTDPDEFESYLADHPAGLFSSFAKARIDYLTNPVPYQPITGERATEVLLASADTGRVAASLNMLGYMPQTRGLSVVDADLLTAFDAYRTNLPDPQAASVDGLHTDAARLTVFLAASTGQRIRTDMGALSSVERTLSVANDAYAQLVDLAGDDDGLKPLLAEAKTDIDAILAARDAVQSRLDASRTYYDSLVLTAQDNYSTIITPQMLSAGDASRSIGNVADRLKADASLFLSHVRANAGRARGSYAWMTDFIRTE